MKTRLIALFVTLVFLAGAAQAQAPAAGPNSELVSQLTQALASTPEQAAGAAGAIFAVAKNKLPPEEWSKVTAAVPGVDEMMQRVPTGQTTQGAAEAQAQAGIRGVTTLPAAFSRLGLKSDQIPTAASVVTEHVSRAAGSAVGKTFGEALQQ